MVLLLTTAVSRLAAAVLLLGLLIPTAAAQSNATGAGENGCDDLVPCKDVEANGLTFFCRISGPETGTPVMMLHGFPEFSIFWVPLQRAWVEQGETFYGIACDLRGYSPGASPSDPDAYLYETLVEDVFAIADSLGIEKFHLLGHDHGAGLGWLTTATDQKQEQRILSWTAMSVPHADGFSEALYGPLANEAQVVASNYFNQFSLVDSATANDGGLAGLFAGLGLTDSLALQKMLWWYYGSVGRYMARPAVVTPEDVLPYLPGAALVQAVQAAVPLPADNGSATEFTVGTITVPTLFICGENDPYLLCTAPYVKDGKYVSGNYTYHGAACGHSVLSVGGESGCSSQAEVDGIVAAVTSHLLEVGDGEESPGETAPGGPDDSGAKGRPLTSDWLIGAAAATTLLCFSTAGLL